MANEWDKMQTTLCWRCPTVYRMEDKDCPHCHAANANVDLERAMAQAEEETGAQRREVENV